ncbi:hypothetical protein D3C84_1034860 [compost metagenome]
MNGEFMLSNNDSYFFGLLDHSWWSAKGMLPGRRLAIVVAVDLGLPRRSSHMIKGSTRIVETLLASGFFKKSRLICMS